MVPPAATARPRCRRPLPGVARRRSRNRHPAGGVPQGRGVVSCSAGQQPVAREGHRVHGGAVAAERGKPAAGPDIPQQNLLVLTGRGEHLPVRAKGESPDLAAVPFESPCGLPVGGAPEPDDAVPAGGGQQCAVRAEVDVEHVLRSSVETDRVGGEPVGRPLPQVNLAVPPGAHPAGQCRFPAPPRDGAVAIPLYLASQEREPTPGAFAGLGAAASRGRGRGVDSGDMGIEQALLDRLGPSRPGSSRRTGSQFGSWREPSDTATAMATINGEVSIAGQAATGTAPTTAATTLLERLCPTGRRFRTQRHLRPQRPRPPRDFLGRGRPRPLGRRLSRSLGPGIR